MSGKQIVRHAGEGDALWLLGGLYEVKASAEETGGETTIMEMTLPVGSGPPAHTHPGGEAVYVLEGTLKYHIGEEEIEGGPGDFFYIPSGTVENFEPTSTVRILVIYTPGGMDRFFSEVAEPARTRELPPPSDEPPDLPRIVEVGARHGMQFRLPAGA